MLILYKSQSNQIYDITKSCKDKKWSGDKQKAPRTLTFSFYKSNEVTIEKGDVVVFKIGTEELFRGMVFKRSFSKNQLINVTVYDLLFSLTKSKDSFSYKAVTLSSIFIDVCKRYNIPIGDVAKTTYIVPEMNESNILAYDFLKKAMLATYQGTNQRYYIRALNGKAHLIKRVEQSFNWIIESGNNLIDYSYEDSIEDIVTQIKLISQDKNTTLTAVASNEEAKKKYGIFTDINQPSGKFSQGQLQELANSMIKNLSKEKSTFSINCLGLADIISGSSVFIKIPALKIQKVFYVDSDSHDFKGDDKNHTMSLKLVEYL